MCLKDFSPYLLKGVLPINSLSFSKPQFNTISEQCFLVFVTSKLWLLIQPALECEAVIVMTE